jgi:hypothetical protein
MTWLGVGIRAWMEEHRRVQWQTDLRPSVEDARGDSALATVRGRASSAAIACFHRCASLTWCGPPSSPKAVARRSRWSSVMGEADLPVMATDTEKGRLSATEEASEAMVKKRGRRR